jgi:NTP pyrophosphatase (non-canonical NTP hydrolase)
MISKEKVQELIKRAYSIASTHGFHEVDRSNAHWLMLVVSEIGEMVEADRNNRHAIYDATEYCDKHIDEIDVVSRNRYFERDVKDTLEDELADVVIRICDFLGTRHIEPLILEETSTSDDWANLWGNDSINEQCYGLTKIITRIDEDTSADDISRLLGASLAWCFDFADFHKFDLLWHVEQKMRYNETRSIRHGKNY